MYRKFFKRFFDIVLAFGALCLLSPILSLVYILVKLDSRGPFLFTQDRLGYRGKVFQVYKIRTMTDEQREITGEIVKGNAEVTRVGNVLRRLKIDELLQLINILKGDMSIVGPRPGLASQISELNEDGKVRLMVRPGLSGLAQINGNIYLTWPERWKYDRKYVENVSFLLDVKIILKTLLIVIVGENKFVNKPHA